MIRVAVIDDHFVVRFGLKAMLDNQPDISFAGEASNALDAVGFVKATRPDVLLLDIRMPERDGIDALREIRSAFPNQKVIMLTTSDADNDVYESLNLGAKGYLLKDRDATEITKALTTVMNGGKYVPEAVRELFRKRQMTPDLTARELEVLRLLPTGMTNDAIAERLGVGKDAIKNHLRNIFVKLDVNDRVSAAREAVTRGFLK